MLPTRDGENASLPDAAAAVAVGDVDRRLGDADPAVLADTGVAAIRPTTSRTTR
jgi:hypothetical protein